MKHVTKMTVAVKDNYIVLDVPTALCIFQDVTFAIYFSMCFPQLLNCSRENTAQNLTPNIRTIFFFKGPTRAPSASPLYSTNSTPLLRENQPQATAIAQGLPANHALGTPFVSKVVSSAFLGGFQNNFLCQDMHGDVTRGATCLHLLSLMTYEM